MVENLRRLVAPLAILCELGVLRFEIGAELLGPRKPALSLGVEDQRDVVVGVDHEVDLALQVIPARLAQTRLHLLVVAQHLVRHTRVVVPAPRKDGVRHALRGVAQQVMVNREVDELD